MISYSHRQPGFFLWLTMIVAAVFIFSVTKLMSGEAPPDSRVILRWIPLATAAVLLVIGWLFGSLTVTIDEEKIVAAFGPGWPRKTVRLASCPMALEGGGAEWVQLASKIENPYFGASRGYVDDVIMPSDTRKVINKALDILQDKNKDNKAFLARPWRKYSNINL